MDTSANAPDDADGRSANAARTFTTRWIGSWHCTDRGETTPLAGARVELWQRGLDLLPKFLSDDLIAVTHADDAGAYEFNTISDGEDDFYVRVLTDDNATVRLGNWWEPWPWFTDTATNQNDVAVQNFGDLAIKSRVATEKGSPECAIWQGVRDSYSDFEATMGFAPPGGRRVVNTNAPALTPLAPYTTILWPPFHPAGPLIGQDKIPSKKTTRHEFGHTFRHAYDGDAPHFFVDAASYLYPQLHEHCTETNLGFAFNEGWAEYWAREFNTDENGDLLPCAKDQSQHQYEGNVALSLLGLEQCTEYERRDLVDALAQSPGQIHSFSEFKERLEALHGPCSQLKAPVSEAVFSLEGRYGWRRYRRTVQKELEWLKQEEQRLRRLREEAKDELKDIYPCWRQESCMSLLVNQIRPPVLGGEVATTRLVRKRLSFQLEREKVRKLGKPMSEKFQRSLHRKKGSIKRGVARVQSEWLAKALKAARPILKHDDSLKVQALGRRLRTSMKAFEAGRIPQGYAWPAASLPLVRSTPPAPDLVIERLFINGSAGYRIYADVRNVGRAFAAPSTTVIAQTGQSPVHVATPGLSPGEMVTVSAECVYHELASATAWADGTFLVDESSESNNEAWTDAGGVNGLCRYP